MSDNEVWYMAHPYGGDASNLERAKRWLRYLNRLNDGRDYCAPWISLCEVLQDADPAERERMLKLDENLAVMCDGVVLVGGRISRGMFREVAAHIRRRAAAGIQVRFYDLFHLGTEPPETPTAP